MLKTMAAAGLSVFLAAQAAAQGETDKNASSEQNLSGGTVELTLDKAIEIALDENPTIRIADLEITRQDYVRKETTGNLMPNLSVTANYNRAIVKNKMGGDVSFEPDNTVSGTANINIPLFAPSVYKTLKMNQEQMNAAVEAARASKITLVNEVKKAYYNTLLSEQSLEVLYASEKNISETVEDTRVRLNNGLASEYDLITAEVQLSNLQPTIIQTKNSIKVSKMMLKMYLGLPEQIDIRITGALDDYAMVVATQPDGIYNDLSGNSDLRAMDIQLKVLERQLQVTRTQRMPTLSAFGSVQIMGRDPLDFSKMLAGETTGGGVGSGGVSSGSVPKSSTSFEWQHPISAGLQLSIPIFSGTSNVQRERQVKNNIAQMKLQRDYLEQNVNVQLNSAINDLLTARETMNANRKTVSQAEKAYSIAQTRYNAGAGTILELNTAELSLTQAKLNFSQSIYDYLSAQADYEKIIGQEK